MIIAGIQPDEEGGTFSELIVLRQEEKALKKSDDSHRS